jgi:hypothetical protein
MHLNVSKEVAALQRMTTPELRARYAEVCGDGTASNNRVWMVKRIAWRLQAQVEGDLTERARRRAAELANDADLRLRPPVLKAVDDAAPELTKTRAVRFQADNRVPPPGTVITRVYKGETLQVRVLADGFEFEGEAYNSLSAVAKHITGSHCNGYLFFNMTGKGDAR